MPPKQAAKGQEDASNPEVKAALHESKRLQALAYRGILSESRRLCSEETTPSRVLLKADGKDITKKSSLRKGRYLLNINAQIAAAAESKMGALSQLDTRNPVLYIDFLEGRLKFLGTLMFPANKYMVLKFGNREILCEDVLDSMVGFNQDRIAAVLVLKVVFSEAYWIGTKAENPDEHILPMPLSIIEAGRKAQEAAETDAVTGTQATANGAHDQPVRELGSQRRRRAAADQDCSSNGEDDEDGEGPAVGRRMSQRSAAKRVKYNVDLSDEDASGDDGDAEADEDGNSREGTQKLKRQPRMPAAARNASPVARHHSAASEQQEEAIASAAGTSTAVRRHSMTAAGNGHLAAVPEETADEHEMTQKSSQRGRQEPQSQEDTSPGRQKAAQPAKQRRLAKVISDDDDEEESEEEEDVIDLSSPAAVSQSQRPRRTASTKGPALRDALSEEESEEAIEEDDGDEDFTV